VRKTCNVLRISFQNEISSLQQLATRRRLVG
jgi:hypothetical protein